MHTLFEFREDALASAGRDAAELFEELVRFHLLGCLLERFGLAALGEGVEGDVVRSVLEQLPGCVAAVSHHVGAGIDRLLVEKVTLAFPGRDEQRLTITVREWWQNGARPSLWVDLRGFIDDRQVDGGAGRAPDVLEGDPFQSGPVLQDAQFLLQRVANGGRLQP